LLMRTRRLEFVKVSLAVKYIVDEREDKNESFASICVGEGA
jgi:hypothetical protein